MFRERPLRRFLSERSSLLRQEDEDEEESISREVEMAHNMIIEVNPSGHGGTYYDVAAWSRKNEEAIKTAIQQAMKNLGFPNKVRVIVGY